MDELKKAYDSLEFRARELALLSKGQSYDKEKFERLRSNLRDIVQNAFQARQELQIAEIAALRKQLDELETAVKTREQLQEVIINERVKELLE